MNFISFLLFHFFWFLSSHIYSKVDFKWVSGNFHHCRKILSPDEKINILDFESLGLIWVRKMFPRLHCCLNWAGHGERAFFPDLRSVYMKYICRVFDRIDLIELKQTELVIQTLFVILSSYVLKNIEISRWSLNFI